MTGHQVRMRLRAFCRAAGGQPKAAIALRTSQQNVSLTLNGTRAPGPKILKALGLRKVVTYEPIGKAR